MDTLEVDIAENVDDLGYNEEYDPEEQQNNRKSNKEIDYQELEEDFNRKSFDYGPLRSKRRNFRTQRPYQRQRGNFRYQNHRESRGSGPYSRQNNQTNRNNVVLKPDDDELKQIEAKLVTLLDSFSTSKEDILSVLEDLKLATDKYNKHIASTLVKCVESFPVKTGAYASLVGLLKVSGKADLVESVSQQVLYNLGLKLSNGDRTGCVLLLRFLIGLHCSNVTSNSVFEILTLLLKLANEVENFYYESSVDYVKSVIILDNLNYMVLASIPWFSRDVFMSNVETITSMCEKLFEYSERRMKLMNSLTSDLEYNPNLDLSDYTNASVGNSKKFNPYLYKYYYKDTVNLNLDDRFTSGVQALKSLLKNDWTSSTTYRFYQSKGIVEKLRDSSDFVENKVTSDNLNSVLHLDLKNFNNFKPLLPKTFNFNYVLDKSQLTTTHDKWLFEEHVYYVFELFSDDSLRCAQQLLAIPLNEEFKEYGIVDVLLNLCLSKFYDNYYSIFGTLVMHNLCTLEEKTEDIFYSYVTQLLAETDKLDSWVLNTLVSISSFWFNMEFCKIRTTSDDINIEGENSDELKKDQIRQKNSRLFKTLFKPNNCANNYNLRLIEKVSRLVYMDRLLIYSPSELESEIRALGVPKDFKNKPYEHLLFLNMLHFNKLADEENELRNRRIVSFINNYTNKPYLKEAPKHLFSETKETKDYDEVIHTDEDVVLNSQVTSMETTNLQEEINTNLTNTKSGSLMSDENAEVWKRDDLIMLFWDTLLIFGSKSMTHLYRLLEFHSDVLKMFETVELPFEESLPYKVMWQTVMTFERDHKRLELSFDFFIRNNVFTCPVILQFLFTLPDNVLLSNFFFYAVNSVFSEVHSRLVNFRENYKVALRELAGTVAMEAKKQELDAVELDYFNFFDHFVHLVSDRLSSSEPKLAKVMEEILVRKLVKYSFQEKLNLKLYNSVSNVHETVKVILYRLAMPSYLSP
uniref:MIF4G like, putative n=1 Tax=Theileria annulata TaxID=5874 RepID=A0A3B0MJK7_THEAN